MALSNQAAAAAIAGAVAAGKLASNVAISLTQAAAAILAGDTGKANTAIAMAQTQAQADEADANSKASVSIPVMIPRPCLQLLH